MNQDEIKVSSRCVETAGRKDHIGSILKGPTLKRNMNLKSTIETCSPALPGPRPRTGLARVITPQRHRRAALTSSERVRDTGKHTAELAGRWLLPDGGDEEWHEREGVGKIETRLNRGG
ncbi:hypothetical protein DPEC_G00091090 [Dallia pectoralis]|uniref:Uncharacterized protein n=1 Tax=Dallia pectoralis TaxID=75939 RepID=A0ACC2H129_DALPE|nr:hypothetical protein DPEC_G00091090 [Dallia pectoralis]